MVRYRVYLQNPHARCILKAKEAIESGNLIIYPTDTVYGIGCSIYNKRAIEKIYRIKGKSKFEPMSIICASIQQAARYVRISNFAFRTLKRCFPGPYTIILEATREIPKLMLSRRKEIGIRIPDSKICQALLNSIGHPILNTSVSLEPGTLLNDPDVIRQRLELQVGVILDAGPLPDAAESTVVSLIGDTVEILREGKGDLERLFS